MTHDRHEHSEEESGELLHAYFDGDLNGTGDRRQLEESIQKDPVAREQYETMSAIRMKLKSLPAVAAPEHLRAKLEAIQPVRTERKILRAWRDWIFPGSIAAAATVVVLFAVYAWKQNQIIQVTPADTGFIEAHQRLVQRNRTAAGSTDPAKIASWFQAKLGYSPLPAELDWAKPNGGWLCRLGKQRGAVIRYQPEQTPESLFVYRGQYSGLKFDPDKKQLIQGEEYSLVKWQKNNLAYVLVCRSGDSAIERLMADSKPR